MQLRRHFAFAKGEKGMPKFVASILLFGSLLIGFAFIAILPPFEGVDEIAHYSYIQQIGQGGGWPQRGDFISAEVGEYFHVAPPEGKWSYHDFFSSGQKTIRAGRAAINSSRDAARTWHHGLAKNWETQHPPVYYALLAPVLRVSDAWSLKKQLFLLRGISYLMAWVGLCIASITAVNFAPEDRLLNSMLILAPALWPVIFPEWYPEMARLGNDSLCLLVIACGWWILQRVIAKHQKVNMYFWLGVVCGIGLLTKATVLPFVVAIISFLIARAWNCRNTLAAPRQQMRGLLVLTATILVISAWWYVKNVIDTGFILGTSDEVSLSQKIGLIKGLQENMSLLTLVGGIAHSARSFLWWGTHSAVLLPKAARWPLALLLGILIVCYLRQFRPKALSVQWVSLLTLLFFLVGIGHALLILIAGWAILTIPTYYLHSIAPVLAPLVARALIVALRWPIAPITIALFIYSILFLPLAIGIEVLYYSGCAVRDYHGLFVVSPAIDCLADGSRLYSNLSILGSPAIAGFLFVIGWVATVVGLVVALLLYRHESNG